MSSRAIRKRQNERISFEHESVESANNSSNESEDEISTSLANPFSQFSLLDDDSDSESSDSSHLQEPESTTEAVRNSTPAKASQPKKARKRRKRKKKKKSPKIALAEKSGRLVDDDMKVLNDEIERIGPQTGDIDEKSPELTPLFSCAPRDFNPDYELRQIFGKDAVRGSGPDKSKKAMRSHQPRRGRRTILVRADEEWPPVNFGHLGLSMDLVGTDNMGCRHFRWSYAEDYQKVERMYEAAANSLDPERIMELLQRYPYHINSLLQMSEIMKLHGQHAESASFVERSVYRFETAFHSKFSATNGTCRIDYSDPANRSFFLALYRQSQNLGNRACPKSALSVLKLLLSLDKSDPMSALLTIDYYALRARQPEFLLRLTTELSELTFVDDFPLRLIPSMAYSCALARWMVDEEPSEISSQEVPSNLSIESVNASVMLFQALLVYPEVVKPLLEKADSRAIQSSLRWQQVLCHPHFIDGANRKERNEAVGKLIDVFVNGPACCGSPGRFPNGSSPTARPSSPVYPTSGPPPPSWPYSGTHWRPVRQWPGSGDCKWGISGTQWPRCRRTSFRFR
eukprot:184725_1